MSLNDETDIPADVRTLIARHVDSVVHLELLLLFQREPALDRTAEQAAVELRVEPAWTAGELARLATRGLLRVADPATPTYARAPGPPELVRAIDGLARAYADRRVSVISLIYAKPAGEPAKPAEGSKSSSPLRTFSDAFRLRKDGKDG